MKNEDLSQLFYKQEEPDEKPIIQKAKPLFSSTALHSQMQVYLLYQESRPTVQIVSCEKCKIRLS